LKLSTITAIRWAGTAPQYPAIGIDSSVPGPRISVVVPTRGRPAALAACLAALARSTLDAEALELVVVGDGDDVAPPPQGAGGRFPLVWRPQPQGGPAAARNHGARVARAPVLAFTDDDCRPAPDWAERMAERVERDPAALVAGAVRNGLPRNLWSSASQLVLDVVVDMYNGRPGLPGFAPSSNIAMRRETFTAAGGFDERFRTAAGEDREFCDRCFAKGHPLVLEPAAVVEHFHHLDARRFIGQYAAYGRGEVTYRAVSAAGGGQANVIDESFYLRLLQASLSHGPVRGAALAILVAASQVAFMASFWAARRRAAGRA
jgi:GT2 family glycosyltransferase